MEASMFGETSQFVVTVIIVFSYEVIKGLVSKGLKTQEAIEEAKWKEGVANSLATLIKMNEEASQKLNNHMTAEHIASMTRRQ